MNIKEFYELVDQTKLPTISNLPKLKFLVDKYPYFQAGIFTYLKCLYINDSDLFAKQLLQLSSFVTDRKALFYYILSDEYARFFRRNGKKELSKDRTSILLDAFFDTLEDSDIESQLEHSITNSSMASLDYFSFIESAETIKIEQESEEHETSKVEEETPTMKHQGIIDDFITKAEDRDNIKIVLTDIQPEGDIENEDAPDDELDEDDIFFTETLANIYIKQRKYQKAYEIIKRLSLNYPEKNIYFADQLSFLEKLIINSKK